MKKLSNTEAELRKRVTYKKSVYLAKAVATIHSSMDTAFFRRARAAMNCQYTMYLTDIPI